ncbi:MAG: hypothetical protein KDB21_14115 [Acidimicrobiales bacterium]|nr:hypothetical protein [Acidimicrobiales bacterium]
MDLPTADGDVTLPPRTPIHVDELLPAVYRVDDAGELDPDTWRKTIIAPPSGHAVFCVRIAPNGSTPVHWHPSDTVYIVRRGELVIPGEGSYREGDIRWVRGGTVYGPEAAGPEGCEFWFVSLGPFASNDPEQIPPPDA